MEEEIEDLVGEVKLSDSQKSLATSNLYSTEFTDCSSDKNNSSGKETYVIELCDSGDSDTFPLHDANSVICLRDGPVSDKVKNNRKAASASHKSSSIAHEIFTQTSKTIFELAQREGAGKESLQTQTSLLSITENKTVEYRIEYKNSKPSIENIFKINEGNCSNVLSNALEDASSKFPVSDSDTVDYNDDISEDGSDRIIKIIDEESNENVLSEENHESNYDHTSDFEDSENNSDMEEDSLMEPRHRRIELENESEISEVPESVDDDVEELYNNLSKNIDLPIDRPYEQERRLSILTPLTEESTIKRESLVDITPNSKGVTDNDILFVNNGVRVKMLSSNDTLKLPPIQNRSCPNSPHLNFLFSVQTPNRLVKSGTLPCLYEDQTGKVFDRWEIGNKDLASGESPLISGRSDPSNGRDTVHLPPIHVKDFLVNGRISKDESQFSNAVKIRPSETQQDAININDKIKELKLKNKSEKKARSKYNIPASDSRSCSPSSGSPDSRLCDASEKGCEALCIELLKLLRSSSWYEVVDTLEEIPKVLERFWGVIAEHRIADLIRQVSVHVESPRTQVARSACNTLASLLKNTNYTKKPDFYEAVTLLLTKTGSFSRPVRRAANVALDEVVCGVDLSHAVTALCIHGVGHKSPLVRCASGRLLVVCSALAGGGRGVLRSRPATAAAARCHALRALSALLDDKNTETRKYAERLYAMLRPLPHFQAYYLTDVDVEAATKQMKKYDKLICGLAGTK